MDKEDEIMDEIEKEDKEKKKLTKSKHQKEKNENKRTNEIDSLNFLVHQYFIRNEFDSCFEVLSKYSKMRSGFESPYSIIIRALISRSGGRLSESLSLFKDCHTLYRITTDTSYILKEIGKTFYLLGKYADAADIYSNVLNKNSEDWDCYYHIGLIYYNIKNYKKAEEAINKAYQINSCKEVLVIYGKIYLKKNDIEKAIDKFEEALFLSPNDIDLLSALGNLYLQQKDKEAAIKAYTEAINSDSKYSNSLIGLSSIHQKNSNYEDSYDLISLGFHSNNNSAYLWNNLGLWYLSKDKKIFAATCLKRALYLAPFEWVISYNLGLIYLKLEQYVTAFIHMNTAVNLNKNNHLSYLYLGIICSELNNDGNAKNCFEKSLAIKEEGITLYNYILFLFKKKMFKEAGEKYEKLLKIFSKYKKDSEEYKLIESQMNILKKIFGKSKEEGK